MKSEFGLLGKGISYSFSRTYFTEKFKRLELHGYSYENFDLPSIQDLPEVLANRRGLKGFNVTIPYKEAIIPYLDFIDPLAKAIGAVNTVNINSGKLYGFNTDAYGFRHSLLPHLKPGHDKALVLGTGGASKAVCYVLGDMGIEPKRVSRTPVAGQLSYAALDQSVMESHKIVVNCTPLGTFPDVDKKPAIPYQYLGKGHLLYDLIYNPELTAFLSTGASQGAEIQNGLRMLELQAEKAWEIWNDSSGTPDPL